jgi:kinetochor protein Mis14/NSL1
MSKQHYDKLDLSMEELRTMYRNVYEFGRQRLDKHLPQEAENNNDQLKNMVFEHLSQAMIQSFDWAKESMVVDGRDDTDSIASLINLKSKQTVVPLDKEANSELRKIIHEVEQETIALTQLRKNLPLQLRQDYQNLLSSTDAEVSQLLYDIDTRYQDKDDNLDEEKIPKFEDLDALIDDYEEYTSVLHSLKLSLPKTSGEFNKINETIDFLEKIYQNQQNQLDGFAIEND